MSKEDIDKAVREAEQFAAEDKKRKEDVDTRNQADQMVYECEKLLSESGDKFDATDKSDLEGKLNALKEALKGTDTAAIKTAQEALTSKFYEVSQKLYQQANPQGAAPGADAGAQQAGPNPDGTYDADFRDVTEE